MKIGLMGGTFNPIHIGHLVLAEQVRHNHGLDRVLFIPTGDPPHKRGTTPSFHRMKMVQLAIADNSYFECSDIEIRRTGKSYTVDTIEALMNQYACSEMYFITGADAVIQLDTWHNPKRLAEITNFISANRPGIDTDVMHQKVEELRLNYGFQIEIVEISALMLSSSEIRERVANQQTIRYLVPVSVEEYIDRFGLYLEHADAYEDCFAIVYQMLGDTRRFYHSLGVARTARKLAEVHGADVLKAELAGLCHDVCKHLDDDEMRSLIQKYRIQVYPCIEANPNLAHGEVGAAFLQEKGLIQDEEVLDAIRWHTYGTSGMSDIAKIVYVADIIEPGRKGFRGLEEMRELAYQSIDDSILKWQEFLSYPKSLGHPGTEQMCIDILQSKAQNSSGTP